MSTTDTAAAAESPVAAPDEDMPAPTMSAAATYLELCEARSRLFIVFPIFLSFL